MSTDYPDPTFTDYPYPAFTDYSYPGSGLDLVHLGHFLVLGATWLLVLISAAPGTLVVWSGKDPASYERYFAAPLRRARWRLWAYRSWPRLAKRCRLSFSEQVTRKDKDGKQTTTTVWTHPKLLQVKASDHCLYLTVRTRTGQTVNELEKAVPAIRDAVARRGQ
jgi:DNA segregation ATPase FtsK/SpoIIIE, S-DNA-T family